MSEAKVCFVLFGSLHIVRGRLTAVIFTFMGVITKTDPKRKPVDFSKIKETLPFIYAGNMISLTLNQDVEAC